MPAAGFQTAGWTGPFGGAGSQPACLEALPGFLQGLVA